MSHDESSMEQLWQQRYRELEETFSMTMTAIAESLSRPAGPSPGEGIHKVWAEVGPTALVEVVASLSGPPQEVSFRVTAGGLVVQEGGFTPSNTLSFQPRTSGTYLVTCTSRALGTDSVMSQKSVEVIVG